MAATEVETAVAGGGAHEPPSTTTAQAAPEEHEPVQKPAPRMHIRIETPTNDLGHPTIVVHDRIFLDTPEDEIDVSEIFRSWSSENEVGEARYLHLEALSYTIRTVEGSTT